MHIPINDIVSVVIGEGGFLDNLEKYLSKAFQV